MHDYNFQISEQQRNEIEVLCQQVIDIGIRNEEFNEALTIEEVYSMVIIYPIEFINLRIKAFFGIKEWSDSDKRKVVEFCINALK
jgi:hypothetical protein